jgi:hypothetical protein
MIIAYGVIHFLRQDVQLCAKRCRIVKKFSNAGTIYLERSWELLFSRRTTRYGGSKGRAMAQAVSRRPLTSVARVRSHADPSGRAV